MIGNTPVKHFRQLTMLIIPCNRNLALLPYAADCSTFLKDKAQGIIPNWNGTDHSPLPVRNAITCNSLWPAPGNLLQMFTRSPNWSLGLDLYLAHLDRCEISYSIGGIPMCFPQKVYWKYNWLVPINPFWSS